MRRSPTPEAKAQMYDIIADIVRMRDVSDLNQAVYEATDKICKWYEEQNTFSDNCTTAGKNCPTCGSLWVISRRHLPGYLMAALRCLLVEGPLSANEAEKMTGNRQVYTKFAWMVHWGLTEKTSAAKYQITALGERFLAGEAMVPEFLWMLKNKVVPTPEGEESPRNLFMYELTNTDTEDHRAHVERSAPASPVAQ